jgi:hypothetical protein
MALLRCLTCRGEYDDVLPDGTLYFHACAPVINPGTGEPLPRPNRRNENVKLDPVTRKAVGIKRDGLGVQVLEGTRGIPRRRGGDDD